MLDNKICMARILVLDWLFCMYIEESTEYARIVQELTKTELVQEGNHNIFICI